MELVAVEAKSVGLLVLFVGCLVFYEVYLHSVLNSLVHGFVRSQILVVLKSYNVCLCIGCMSRVKMILNGFGIS